MSKNNVRRRSLYVPADIDDAVIDLSKKWGKSVSASYQQLVEMGVVVEIMAMEGVKVIGHFPDGKEIEITDSRWSLKPKLTAFTRNEKK